MRQRRTSHRSLERRITAVVGAGSVATLILYPFLLVDPVELDLLSWRPYILLTSAGTLVSAALASPTVRRWVPHHRQALLDLVFVGSILTTIVAAIGTSGTATSELHYLLVLPLLLAAVSFRPRSLAWLGCYTLAALGVAYTLTGAAPLPARTLARVVTVGGSVVTVAWLTAALRTRLEETRTARSEAHELAESLTTVAVAATTVNTLEPEVVLRSLLAATIGVGYRAAAVLRADGDASGASAGARDDVTRLTGDDADVRDALALTASGDLVERPWDEHGAIARYAPITSDDETIGVLAAVARDEATDPRVLGLQILAAQAGNALANVRRFEQEQALVKRMQAFDEMQHDLISTASHELRTPVTVVKGVAELVASRWDEMPEDQRRTLVGRIGPHVAALEEVLDRLSEMMEVHSAAHPELRMTSVDLGMLIARALDTCAQRLGDRLVRTDAPDSTVEVDAGAVHRALVELLDNVAAHSKPEAIVWIRASVHDERVLVEITNDGVELCPEDVDGLVRPFARAGDVLRRTTRGLGVGLSLVEHIATSHRGAVEIDADAATFTVRLALPVGPDAPAAACRTRSPEESLT